MKTILHFTLSCITLLLTFGVTASAEIIFSDDFDHGTVNLNGQTPDTTTGGANWVAGSDTRDVFSGDGVYDGNKGSATLAFTPVEGLVYTMDASLTLVANPLDEDWIAMGFSKGQDTGNTTGDNFTGANVAGMAWMLARGDASASDNLAVLGSGTTGISDSASWSSLATQSGGDFFMRIVLDTTAGAGDWTVNWYLKTTSGGSYVSIRPEAVLLDKGIDSVGFATSNNNVDGTIHEFSLVAVPEPSSLMLIALALAGGLGLIRRRR